MTTVQALFALASIILVALAAFGVAARVHLALLGAACALTAYFLPLIAHGF